MNQSRIFFDTNVLIYAHDRDSTFHRESALLLKSVFSRQVKGIIAEQNIIKLYRVLTNSVAMKGKSLTPLQATDLIAQTYRNGIFDIVYPNNFTMDKVMQLAVSGNVVSAKIFDIRLAALIIETNIDYFATYNVKHFKEIDGLNPLTPAQILTALS
ncbi:putative PilT protein [Chondrocystis sp. NIES-4102]|nr:putative PilT protein [Chondrocystis sp. NIES-4102]